jgi:hypothetical protein
MTKAEPEFTRRGFHGAVLATEYMPLPHGPQVRGLVGSIDVLTDTELLGFEVNDRDSRWGVRVSGPSGVVVVLPGCKVFSVMAFPTGGPGAGEAACTDYWTLP